MRKVSPFDCVLLNTLPFSEKDFLDDLANTDKHDFCASILRKNSALNNDGAWMFYKPILRVLSLICNEAKKIGVQVVTHAVLNDLKKYTEKYEVITLIAHCRLSGIITKDILNSIELLYLLKNPQNNSQEEFSKMIEYQNPDLLNSLQNDTLELQLILARTLNAIVEKSHRFYMYPPGGYVKDNNNLLHFKKFTRLNLEQAFPGLIRDIPIIEFRDNMYSIMDVISNINEHFSGFLDLTICNSLIFGDTIKAYRPSCLIAINQYQASIDVRMLRYKAIIKLLSYQKDTYLNALKKIHTAFLEGGFNKMKTIEKFLKKYRTIDLAPAGDCEKITLSNSQIDEIKFELKQIRKNNRSYFWIGVAMIIVLFTLSLIIIITNLDKSETLTSVFTAFGCTTFGLISFMIYCWRQKCLTETLITLSLYLQGDTLQTVIDILASQVKSKFKI